MATSGMTSHEVVVNTIAATTTRTGLRVHAELDTDRYPLGVAISDEHWATLPLHRHDWHGDWNYTLDPHQGPPPAAPGPPGAPGPPTQPHLTRPDTRNWAAPALTGISTPDWNTLTTELLLPYQAYREAELHIRRGGPCWRKPAGGHPPALTLPDMLLVTVLRARYRLPRRILAELFAVTDGTIATAERRIKPLLDQRKHATTPTGTRFRSLDEFAAHAATHGVSLNTTQQPASQFETDPREVPLFPVPSTSAAPHGRPGRPSFLGGRHRNPGQWRVRGPGSRLLRLA